MLRLARKNPSETYVTLCRELNLEHEFAPGDWYWWNSFVMLFGQVTAFESIHGFTHHEVPLGSCWLPSLSDWLEILRTQGWDTNLESYADGSFSFEAHEPFDEKNPRKQGRIIEVAEEFRYKCGPEEAAARVWMEVMDKRLVP